MSNIKNITAQLEASDRPHAATALENVKALAAIADVEGLAPFVEGYCHYLATGKGQGALDSLRAKDKATYGILRAKIIKASGVTRMSSRSAAVNDEAIANVKAFLEA